MAKGRKGGVPGNMGNMMKQVQQMQKNMAKMQEEIEVKEFTATAGGGAISVTVNGKKEILNIKLEEAIVDPDDIEMLQDLIIVAVNEALREAGEAMEKSMGSMTGGMSIPGLF